MADGALVRTHWLEVFRGLVGEEPGGLRGVAWVVDLLGAGRGAVAAEVLPLQAVGEEDPNGSAAVAAHGDGVLVFEVSPTGGAAAVNAISNACGSIMLKNASAASI